MEIEKEVVHKIYEEGKSQNYIKGVIEKHHSPYHCEFTISHTYSIYRTTLFNILDCLYPKPVIEDIYYEKLNIYLRLYIHILGLNISYLLLL